MRSKILFTGFKKANARDLNSTVFLLETLPKKNYFLFTNDFDCIKREVEELFKEKWDKIVMFGQKPVVKSLRVERCARLGDEVMQTNCDLLKIESLLNSNDIAFKWSDNPGNFYCNYAYFQVLKMIELKELKTEVIFIHIPYLDNFVQMDKLRRLLEAKDF